MDSRMESSVAVSAPDMSSKARESMKGLVHHFDRGVQYAAMPFRELLLRNGIAC